MPTPEIILDGLRQIANDWQVLAIIWHVYFAALASVLLAGMCPTKRTVGILLSLPLLSVSALAWQYSNPFNGIFFSLTGAALLFISFRLPCENIRMGSLWTTVAGTVIFFFGWTYPHFLETTSFLPYLYSAPAGLIPCPTLSIVIGLSIIVGSLGDRAWSIVLATTGIFYGMFGAVHLDVSLDWVLLIGALLIMFTGSKHTTGTQSGAVS